MRQAKPPSALPSRATPCSRCLSVPPLLPLCSLHPVMSLCLDLLINEGVVELSHSSFKAPPVPTLFSLCSLRQLMSFC